MYGGRKLDSKVLTGRVLSRAESDFGGRCISIYETLEEKKCFGAENRDSDTIYSQLLAVENCEAVIVHPRGNRKRMLRKPAQPKRYRRGGCGNIIRRGRTYACRRPSYGRATRTEITPKNSKRFSVRYSR